VEPGEIEVKSKITQAVDNKEFLLIPRVSSASGTGKTGSAMIAPIMDPTGCFGVLYVDNSADRGPYSLSDLDYLMLLAIHTAAIVENF
jgi:GAF domain-containing protein